MDFWRKLIKMLQYGYKEELGKKVKFELFIVDSLRSLLCHVLDTDSNIL